MFSCLLNAIITSQKLILQLHILEQRCECWIVRVWLFLSQKNVFALNRNHVFIFEIIVSVSSRNKKLAHIISTSFFCDHSGFKFELISPFFWNNKFYQRMHWRSFVNKTSICFLVEICTFLLSTFNQANQYFFSLYNFNFSVCVYQRMCKKHLIIQSGHEKKY